jgi:hypothetical protein
MLKDDASPLKSSRQSRIRVQNLQNKSKKDSLAIEQSHMATLSYLAEENNSMKLKIQNQMQTINQLNFMLDNQSQIAAEE